MKGVFLIMMLLGLLIVGYLTMKRTTEPTEDLKAIGGVPLIDAPAAAEAQVNQAMQKEVDRVKALDKEMNTNATGNADQ